MAPVAIGITTEEEEAEEEGRSPTREEEAAEELGMAIVIPVRGQEGILFVVVVTVGMVIVVEGI